MSTDNLMNILGIIVWLLACKKNNSCTRYALKLVFLHLLKKDKQGLQHPLYLRHKNKIVFGFEEKHNKRTDR